MKKVILIALDLFSILFLLGAYLIHYFTVRKLGMNRWVVYHQMKAKELLPVDLLRFLVPVLTLLLVFLLWKAFLKRRHRAILNWFMMLIMTLLQAGYLLFSVIMNGRSVKAFYLLLPMIGLSLLMLILRNLIQVIGREK